MTDTIGRSRAYLRELFAGPFPGHALLFSPPHPPAPGPGDVLTAEGDLAPWVDQLVAAYEVRLAWHEALDDDSVPYAKLNTGTELFAAAFGCRVHVYEDSPPAARPLVLTAEEADRLAEPELDRPPLDRVFQVAQELRRRLGPEAPLGVPDIQSPFDIAALIWNKEDMFVAMYHQPAAVKWLVDKCRRLLEGFLAAWQAEFWPVNLCHCPYAWAPPELGCWLSEDEAGALSTAMFEEFCLPSLAALSERFGGLFVHCCATADHQYESFRKVPNLRGLNRVFQYPPGFEPAIRAFSGGTVLMMAWLAERQVNDMLDASLPETRWLFDLSAPDLDAAKAMHERLRERCPRTSLRQQDPTHSPSGRGLG